MFLVGSATHCTPLVQIASMCCGGPDGFGLPPVAESHCEVDSQPVARHESARTMPKDLPIRRTISENELRSMIGSPYPKELDPAVVARLAQLCCKLRAAR